MYKNSQFLYDNEIDLIRIAKIKKENYIYADPFPHIVLDNIFNEKILNNIVENFLKI